MEKKSLSPKKVILTGATSFTGAHIAKALLEQGTEVFATLTKALHTYENPSVMERMEFLEGVHWVEETPMGSEQLLRSVNKIKPDVFINHGAAIQGYRDPGFDFLKSVGSACAGLEDLINILATQGCGRIVHTGSVFEPDEGRLGGEAVSIYGVSKNLTWQVWRFFSQRRQLPISKVVIPNPIGVFENLDRLGPLFVKKWKNSESTILSTPDLVRDHIPATWLANIYVQEANSSVPGLTIRRPSAFKMSNADFVKSFASHAELYLKIKPSYRIEAKPSAEPIEKVNTENVPELLSVSKNQDFWKNYFEWLGESRQ